MDGKWKTTWTWLFPLKGGRPVTNWYRMAPTLHRSAWIYPSHYMPCQRLNIEHFPTLHLNLRQQKQNPHKDSTKGNTLASYFFDCNISGAMYNGDPHRVSAIPCGCSNLSTEPVTPTSKYCMMPKTSQVISKSTRMLRGSPRQMTVTLPLMHVSLIPTGPTPSVER